MSSGSRVIWRQTFALDEIGGDPAHDWKFVPTESRGTIEVTYGVDPTGVSVSVRVIDLTPGYTEVEILNEQSAAFDNFAEPGQTFTGPAFGIWMPATGSYDRLRSASLGLEWSVSPIMGSRLYAGREVDRPLLDWAGLDYVFPAPFNGTSYHINVGTAR
jgi:hypothetical protein